MYRITFSGLCIYSISQLISVCRIRVCRSRDPGIDGRIILRLLLNSPKFFEISSHRQIGKLVHKKISKSGEICPYEVGVWFQKSTLPASYIALPT